jgi:PIN domain nuclease of toxin-antitoxin system
MKLLIDTPVLVWAATGDPKLCSAAVKLIDDDANTLYFRAASICELTIIGTLLTELWLPRRCQKASSS